MFKYTSTSSPLRVVVAAFLCVFLLNACGRVAHGPYSPKMEQYQRDIPKATKLYEQAMQAYELANFEEAELLLQQCLNADLYHGPAHNNLGVIFLEAGKLYEAAMEFTWARKLMPGHPDPRVNLAAVLDAGGQREEALSAARAALEVQARYIPAIQTIALIQVRDRDVSKETLAFLGEIQYRGETKQWRNWATEWLTKLEN